MKREYDKFYEKEQPETIIVKSGELRLFRNSQRLGVSKPSFESITIAIQTEAAATISQAVKLFLSPDTTIKSGPKRKVTQTGVTTEYSSGGVFLYPKKLSMNVFSWLYGAYMICQN